MAGDLHNLYQIKVSLEGVKPSIWRRLVISRTTDLSELHYVIQIAMGWTHTHLHQFVAGDERFGMSDLGFEDDTIPEEGIPIDAILRRVNQWITYEYDFGDGWEHEIVLEKILPSRLGESVPKCIGGRRGCPPEDVGGVWGYERLLEAYNDETRPEHEELAEWAGEDFDPERFDIEEVNRILSGEL